MRGDVVLGFGVLAQFWKNRAQASLFLSSATGRYDLLWAIRNLSEYLDEAQRDCTRIECSVLSNFSQGHRMAEVLGFRPEGLMRQYDPLGRDHTLYSRIR